MEANNSGRIIPREGVDAEYDDACKNVREVESKLMEHLKEQRRLLGDAYVRICLKMGKELILGHFCYFCRIVNVCILF